jgi:FkbH-like protein
MEINDLRSAIDQSIAAGDAGAASAQLATLWERERGPAAAAFVVSRYEKLRDQLPLRPYRLGILRSFTVEPLIPLLRAQCFTAGIDLTVRLGEFNTYVQEIVDPASWLYAFSPHAVILTVQTRDVCPELWRDYADLTPEARRECVERAINSFADCVRAFRKSSSAHLVIHNLEQPEIPNDGIRDAQASDGQAALIRHLNNEIRSVAQQHKDVYVLDYDALVARHGRATWHDERKWLLVRMPIAAANLIHLSSEWVRFVHALAPKLAKVLVLDLDNTVWGGVIGEDGFAGIRLSDEHPGAAYVALQRAVLDLQRRGILLAICSKNNPDDALEVLGRHPGMILRREHFSCLRINWNHKVDNLRAIAEELNVGTEALAFVDDNPFEREQVRSQMPEVTVIELPADPAGYAKALRESPVFERLTISDEDRLRSTYYAGQHQRAELEKSVRSREDFYYALEQEAEIAPVGPLTLARVAQLTQKTNQFNLTTRRYTEEQLTRLIADPDNWAFSLKLKDRYGDNGLIGVAILRRLDENLEIDTLLLSCRVIGRTVETALISFLAEYARSQGARELEGWFFPTAKNAPAKEFYANHGFSRAVDDANGSLWKLDLSKQCPECPDWIRLSVPKQDLYCVSHA